MFENKSTLKVTPHADSGEALGIVVPETVREAVREAQASGREAQQRAMFAMPFRQRLKERDGDRPRTTQAILAGIDPKSDTFDLGRLDEDGPPPAYAPAPRQPEMPRAAVTPVQSELPEAFQQSPAEARNLPHAAGEGDEPRTLRGKIADWSQFAFAGLAVLGLAGLSVMAAESALSAKKTKVAGDDPSADPFADTAPVITASANASAASARMPVVSVPDSEVAAPAPPATAPQQWFDYNGVANMLAARKAEADKLQAELAAANTAKQLEADRQAAQAIADLESRRLADEAARNAIAAETQKLADAAERQRLADLEAARLAAIAAETKKAEQLRLAEAKAAEEARAAEAERLRVAQAEAEAERVRLAAEAKKAAEANRLAELERERLAAQAEQKRLAALKAEEARLASVAATAAKPKVKLGPPVMVAHEGFIPSAASRKPVRTILASTITTAPVMGSAVTAYYPAPMTQTGTNATVTPPQPVVPYRAAELSVAPLVPAADAYPSSQLIENFIAERTQRTSSDDLNDAQLVLLKAQFLGIVDTAPDGSERVMSTPDGRELKVTFERTAPRDWGTGSVSTIALQPLADASQPAMRYMEQPPQTADTVTVMAPDAAPAVRYLVDSASTSAPAEAVSYTSVPVNQASSVSIMCRDISYAFPGQERGRFAACKTPDGVWTISRASDLGYASASSGAPYAN
jgi:hypothetical protein